MRVIKTYYIGYNYLFYIGQCNICRFSALRDKTQNYVFTAYMPK